MRSVLVLFVLVVSGCTAPVRTENGPYTATFQATRRARAVAPVVVAPPPPSITLHGSHLTLEGLDDEALEATLIVEGDRSVALDLSLTCPEGVSVAPRSVTIPAGRSASLELRVPAGVCVQGEIVFEARTRDRGAIVARRPLPISVVREHPPERPVEAPPSEPVVAQVPEAPVPVAPTVTVPEEPAPPPRVEVEPIVATVPTPPTTLAPEPAPVVSALVVPVVPETPAPVVVTPRSVPEPAPAIVAPPPSKRPLVAVTLLGLAALAVAAVLVRERTLARRFGRKQLRAIGSNRRLSYERYLLRERRTSWRTALAPEGPLALSLEVQDASVLVTPLEGSEVFAADGTPIEAGARLEHGTVLRVVRGAFDRRFIYLARDPSGDELVKSWGPRVVASEEGKLEDEDVFVILEERHELVAPSARLVPPELDEPIGLDPEETVILTDSTEERLLDD